MAGVLRVDEIRDTSGTGSPTFPNRLPIAELAADGAEEGQALVVQADGSIAAGAVVGSGGGGAAFDGAEITVVENFSGQVRFGLELTLDGNPIDVPVIVSAVPYKVGSSSYNLSGFTIEATENCSLLDNNSSLKVFLVLPGGCEMLYSRYEAGVTAGFMVVLPSGKCVLIDHFAWSEVQIG